MLHVLRSIARTVTPLAMDAVDRARDTGIAALLAKEIRHRGTGKKGQIEITSVFPELQLWQGDRETQGADLGHIDYEVDPYHATSSYDRLNLDLGNPLAEGLIRELAEGFGEAWQEGKLPFIYRVLQQNPISGLDGQDLLDTDHRHLGGQPYSNLIRLGSEGVPLRADAENPTLEEVRRELVLARHRLVRNRILGQPLLRTSQIKQQLIVICRDFATWSQYDLLLDEDRIDGSSNRFKGTFELILDPSPAEGTETSTDFIWARPNGPRPVIFIRAKDPTGVQFDESQAFRSRKIDFGLDGIMGFCAGYPQTICRVEWPV